MDLQTYLTANTQNLSDDEKKALGLTNPVKADGTPDTEPKGVTPKSYSINELYEMVNEKLDVSAHILEIIVYGASVRNSDAGDFRLPKAGTSAEMGF
jgi:hypothetical protein